MTFGLGYRANGSILIQKTENCEKRLSYIKILPTTMKTEYFCDTEQQAQMRRITQHYVATSPQAGWEFGRTWRKDHCLGTVSGLCPYTCKAQDEDRHLASTLPSGGRTERKVNYLLLPGKYRWLPHLPLFNACRTWKSLFFCAAWWGSPAHVRGDNIPLDPKTGNWRQLRFAVCFLGTSTHQLSYSRMPPTALLQGSIQFTCEPVAR